MRKDPTIHPALLQKPAGDPKKGLLRCGTCERHCVLGPDQVGWCCTRQNRDGKIVTLTYGMISSLSANPIEKKPLYHFYPGSISLTAGSFGCNLACPWCQNWQISKCLPPEVEAWTGQVKDTQSHEARSWDFFTPARFVAEAINRHCQSISISFNEPTLSLEWSLEAFRLAHQAGLYNTFVTNGYMSNVALERLAEAGLDGMNVDLKGNAKVVREYCEADVDHVWRNLSRAQELGIWFEITTLVIPGVNDDLEMLSEMARKMVRMLGPHTPWHVTRYHPAYQLHERPTSTNLLEQTRTVGREAGLRYVYIGNVPGHFGENTYCPSCGGMLVQRWGLSVVTSRVRGSHCPDCGEELPGIGWNWERKA
jgi:pyruvate formate lyase activating enzyme